MVCGQPAAWPLWPSSPALSLAYQQLRTLWRLWECLPSPPLQLPARAGAGAGPAGSCILPRQRCRWHWRRSLRQHNKHQRLLGAAQAVDLHTKEGAAAMWVRQAPSSLCPAKLLGTASS